MIGCKMISYREEELIYRTEFIRFGALLQEWFPMIHRNCRLILSLKGKSWRIIIN